jgi:transposase
MKYIMDEKTLGRLALIQGAVEGKYTAAQVAKRLGLSARRVKQLKRTFREDGVSAVIHGNSNRHPANYTDDKLRGRILSLKKSNNYKDTNFTHFRELLAELEGIEISYTTLSRILKSGGITSKRSCRTEGRRYKRRKRKEAFGDMLQGDGSEFDWFGSGRRCSLHGFIDDATGKITGLYFCLNECLMGYLEILRQTLLKYGIPNEFYLDKASVFFVNNKKPENWTIEEQLAGRPLNKTQFGVIANEQLGITMTRAHTPQATGRIEKMWGTLQDRLPTMLRLWGINTMEQANGNVEKIIEYFNSRFAVEPETAEPSFEKLHESIDVDKTLAVRYRRTTDNCGCFSFNNFIFQIDSKKPFAKKEVQFLFSERIGFQAKVGQEYVPVSLLGIKNKGKISAMPDVTMLLLEREYYTDCKKMAA